MRKISSILYVVTLRMKQGELDGIKVLREDVADCVLPYLIIPPANERNSDSETHLFEMGEAIPDVGGTLSKYWLQREAFLDLTYLLKEHGYENAVNWLPNIFNRARGLNVKALPAANLTDLEQINPEAFTSILPVGRLKFGLRILSAEMTDPSLDERIQNALSKLGLLASDCAIFADFSDADLSDQSLVAPIIRSALEQFQEFGQWQHVVFQGTNYPDKNPAQPGQTSVQPRSEWLAWRDAVKFDPSTAEHMVFGDFAADCAKIDFGGKGGRPIPHCRYATESDWLVVRGGNSGSQYDIMKNVFERILNSGKFSGAGFSEADAYIHDVANNILSSAGNASTWRQLNTTHHITRVVTDIAKVRGIQIAVAPAITVAAQLSLIDTNN